MNKPDAKLMAEAQALFKAAAALRDRGLVAEADAKQREGTDAWLRALGRVDPVRAP